jgi:hypothetical protein
MKLSGLSRGLMKITTSIGQGVKATGKRRDNNTKTKGNEGSLKLTSSA